MRECVYYLGGRGPEVGGRLEGGWREGGGDHDIAGQFIQLSVHTGARGAGPRRGRHHENSVMVSWCWGVLQSIY